MDISNIDLGNLDKEELEKVKMILDIAKIQDDMNATRANIEAMRENNERSRERHQMDLETAREESEQRRERHQMDLEAIRASVEQMRITNDKHLAETAKLRKETFLYPWFPLLVSVLAMLVAIFK